MIRRFRGPRTLVAVSAVAVLAAGVAACSSSTSPSSSSSSSSPTLTLDKGSAATGDYERLKEPAVDAALAKLAGAPTVTEQTAALVPIENYVAANLPVIPITTASDWFEYNSQHWTGWPTQSNPYESGQPSGTNNNAGTGTDEVVILHLRPA